jgi:hypothetical protein
VRLEDGHQAPRPERACGSDRRRHLRRVVGVVVHHARARRRAAQRLEAPSGAGEAQERRGGLPRIGARQPADLERRGRVARVVQPRDGEADVQAAPGEARAALLQHRRGDVEADVGTAAAQRHDVRALPEHCLWRLGQQLGEGRAQLGQRAERRVVVELDVGHDDDLGVEGEHRAVGLVGLHDEPLAGAPVGVQAGRAQLAADEIRRLQAAGQQRVGHHRRRRRLAVRAGDRDRALQSAELAQEVGARVLAQAALARRDALRVLGGDGRAVDHLDVVARWDVVGRVAGREVHTQLAQGRGDRTGGGPVRAADARAELRGHARVAAHPRAPDTDQMQPPAGPRARCGTGRGEPAQPSLRGRVVVAMPSDRPGAWSALSTALLVIAAIVIGVILSLI